MLGVSTCPLRWPLYSVFPLIIQWTNKIKYERKSFFRTVQHRL